MADRQRVRTGRGVLYYPTAAEAAASGAGPYSALITDVDVSGAVDLLVNTPGDALGAGLPALDAVLADPLIVQADASANGVGYVQGDVVSIEDLANANKVGINAMVGLLNQLRSYQLDTRKNAVTQGTQPGQYSLLAGSAAP